MKLRNILSVFCFLAAMASCSMEDDTMMNDTQEQLQKENVSNGNVYLSFNAGLMGLETRSGDVVDESSDPETYGKSINSCSMILYAGNEILYVQDNLMRMPSQIEGFTPPFPEGTVVDRISKDAKQIHVLTKKRTGLSVMIVANTTLSLSNRSSYPDMRAVNAAIEDLYDAEIDGTNLLKVGTADINFDDKTDNPKFEATTGTAVINDGTTTNIYVQKVTVTQRAAAIRLRSFKVDWKAGTEAPVRITKVELLNSNLKVHLDGNQVDATTAYKTLKYSLPEDGLFVYKQNADGSFEQGKFLPFTQFSFPNFPAVNNKEDNNRVKMKIYYTVGDSPFDCEFIINRPGTDTKDHTEYVHSNYIYYLDVTAHVTNYNVNCDVVCYTQDWINHDITGSLTR